MPKELNDKLFMRVKEMASIPNLTASQMIAYYRCMLDNCAYYDSLQTSMEEGKMAVARTMKANGLDPSLISKCCGISLSEIEKL